MKLAEDLKKAVLQAAMQGKLTKQLKSDSSVDELLKKIADEKAKLIEEGKIKKEKPLAEIKEEEIPFDIPENWRWELLSNISSKITDFVASGSFASLRENVKYYSSEEYAILIRTTDFRHNFKKDLIYVDKHAYEFLNNSNLFGGELILPNIGASIGKVFIVPKLDKLMTLGPNAVLIRIENDLLRKWLFFYFQSSAGQLALKLLSSSTAQAKFNKTELRLLPIPLPPIEEQQRIVEKLNQILPLIDEYGKEEDELIALCQKFPEEMKKSVLQAAMQGKLTEQLENDSSVDELLKKIADEKEKLIEEGKIKKEKPLKEITEDEIPFEIPDNWRWERWGNLSNSIQYGYNASAISYGFAKMVRISDIQDNKILWDSVPYCEITESEYEKYKLNNTDILFARTGGTVGKSVLVSGLTERSVYAGYLIRSHYNHNLNPQYLKYFMECPLYWNQLTQGTTKGCQPNCNGQTLSQMIVPLPPIEEQQRIVEKLNTILPIIDSMAIYGTKKKAGRPKQEEALAFISSLLGTQKSSDSKPISPEILELKAKAKEELPAIVKKYADLMGVSYNRITIRHQKTRWGSCTKTGNLSFNCLLMKMPENVRDYVIIHELAHRKELNHSSKYWAIVAEYCPWYKDAKLWLKENGNKLMENENA